MRVSLRTWFSLALLVAVLAFGVVSLVWFEPGPGASGSAPATPPTPPR